MEEVAARRRTRARTAKELLLEHIRFIHAREVRLFYARRPEAAHAATVVKGFADPPYIDRFGHIYVPYTTDMMHVKAVLLHEEGHARLYPGLAYMNIAAGIAARGIRELYGSVSESILAAAFNLAADILVDDYVRRHLPGDAQHLYKSVSPPESGDILSEFIAAHVQAMRTGRVPDTTGGRLYATLVDTLAHKAMDAVNLLFHSNTLEALVMKGVLAGERVLRGDVDEFSPPTEAPDALFYLTGFLYALMAKSGSVAALTRDVRLDFAWVRAAEKGWASVVVDPPPEVLKRLGEELVKKVFEELGVAPGSYTAPPAARVEFLRRPRGRIVPRTLTRPVTEWVVESRGFTATGRGGYQPVERLTVVIDVSGSMTATTVTQFGLNPYNVARAVAYGFMRLLAPSARVVLIAFSDEVEVETGTAAAMADRVVSRGFSVAGKGTVPSKALEALAELHRDGPHSYILFISDFDFTRQEREIFTKALVYVFRRSPVLLVATSPAPAAWAKMFAARRPLTEYADVNDPPSIVSAVARLVSKTRIYRSW